MRRCLMLLYVIESACATAPTYVHVKDPRDVAFAWTDPDGNEHAMPPRKPARDPLVLEGERARPRTYQTRLDNAEPAEVVVWSASMRRYSDGTAGIECDRCPPSNPYRTMLLYEDGMMNASMSLDRLPTNRSGSATLSGSYRYDVSIEGWVGRRGMPPTRVREPLGVTWIRFTTPLSNVNSVQRFHDADEDRVAGWVLVSVGLVGAGLGAVAMKDYEHGSATWLPASVAIGVGLGVASGGFYLVTRSSGNETLYSAPQP